MSKWSATVAGLWLGAAGAVSAQAPAPAATASQAAASQAARAPTSEQQAAMERAQRMAANPLKVILQASKIRRRNAEPEPEPVDPASLRRTAVRSEAPAPAVAAAAPVPAPAPVPTPVSAVVVSKVMGDLPDAATTPSQALDAASLAASGPVIAKAVAPAALPLPPLVVQPTLASMVEPEIPMRLLAEANRVNEVAAELSLRADGSVAEVKLLPPVPRSWVPFIVSALERWRFQPLPSARVHRVQLVFDER